MGRRRPEARREEILAATVAVIEHRGFAARVTDVADLLGSARRWSLHFGSKDALLARAFEYAAERDLERLQVALATGSEASDRLRRILRLYGPRAPRPGGCCGSTRGRRRCACPSCVTRRVGWTDAGGRPSRR